MQVRTDLAQAPLQFQGEILILHKINFRAVTDTELCLKPLQMSFPYYLPYPFFGAEIILLFPQCLRFQEYEDNYPAGNLPQVVEDLDLVGKWWVVCARKWN